MTHVILAFDGTDEGAPARRAASMAAHVAHISASAAAGQLLLGLPLHDENSRSLGSLMFVAGDAAARDAYLAAEPFAREGVWQRIETHGFRIAPLPYRPWPPAGSPGPTARTHSITIAWDGSDEAALDRRLAARGAHLLGARPMAEDGTLLMGGAILSPEGRMVGSIAITSHTSHDAVRDWLAVDPYVTGDVWRDITLYATRLRPLPYAPLPRD
jgi:uncharacterized protein YciI